MIETKTETTVTCDRCKKKVEGNTYYTIDIYGHNTDPNDWTLSMDAAVQNVETSMSKAHGTQKHICPLCIGFIKSFIDGRIIMNRDGTIKLEDC